jgi:hypothetical protein
MPDAFDAMQPSERRDLRSRDELIRRVQQEFEGLAGLALTLPQAMRLFRLDVARCERLLNELVQRGELVRADEQTYRRA